MPRRHIALSAGLLCLALPLAVTAARAESGAALLVDVSGTTQPAHAAYSEILPGETIELAPQSTIKFVHYQTCREVTVTGGTLHISGPDYQMSGGKIVSETQQVCPQQVKIGQTTAISGGLVLRGALKFTEVTSHPAFVVVGDKADTVTSVSFVDETTQKSVSMPVKDRHISWTKGENALKTGDNYKMTLSSNDNRELSVISIRAVQDDLANALIIRVD